MQGEVLVLLKMEVKTCACTAKKQNHIGRPHSYLILYMAEAITDKETPNIPEEYYGVHISGTSSGQAS